MRSAIIGFAAGVAYLQIQAELPPLLTLILLCSIVVLLVLAVHRVPQTPMRLILRLGGGAIFGFVWAALVAHHYLSQELPADMEGRDITIIGRVDSLPHHFTQGLHFHFAVEQVPSGDKVPERVALSWYYPFNGGDKQQSQLPQPGERWQLNVRLRKPHGNANPHGFDYEVWLLERRLRATGTVRADAALPIRNERLAESASGPGVLIERGRGMLRDRIFTALPDKEYAGVIVALVIGDQRAISQSDWKVFNRTGISHLVSISGLHITMIAGMVAAIVNALWRRSFFTGASLPLILPAQKAAALAGVITASVYVALAGFGVPAQRTLYMLMVVALALWSGRIASVFHVLCIALAAVLLIDPWAVLWPGFWLSFGAIALILYVSACRTSDHAEMTFMRRCFLQLKAAAHIQYAITIGLVPLTMLLFGQISLVSPVANALAIPLISFLITPLALVGSILPSAAAAGVLGLAHSMVERLAAFLSWLDRLPMAVWQAPAPAAGIFALALAGTFWILAPRGWPLRWLGVLAWLPLLLNAPLRPPPQQVWITAFDVGQGSALLIETERHRLLYDTGPPYSPESDGATRVILPYLRGRGIDALDAVVISHGDLDHSGGALSVFNALKVKQVWSSLPTGSPVLQAAPNHVRCAAGQSWSWDSVRFDILHPPSASYDEPGWKPNARSCTLKVTLGDRSILLPGDIERMQEAQLVALMAEQLRATVLLAPHHGSGTSSTWSFLRAVQAELALFQVGYRNRYRHPKAEVYQRYADLGIRRLRTDQSGAIQLRIGEQIDIDEYRVSRARYWHGR